MSKLYDSLVDVPVNNISVALSQLIDKAYNRKLTVSEVSDLLGMLSDNRFNDYSDTILKLLYLSGPFRNTKIFERILETLFLTKEYLEKNELVFLRNIIIKEILSANNALLVGYKPILERFGVKAGRIADYMLKRGIILKDYKKPAEIKLGASTRTRYYKSEDIRRAQKNILKQRLMP